MLPELEGRPIQVLIRDHIPGHPAGGEALAGTSIRDRKIYLNAELLCDGDEFTRILMHELMHFAWVRLGNPARRSWEQVIQVDRSPGELGWSAEWRKRALSPEDRGQRTRRWRQYACESFCDAGAFLYSGITRHDEFTLAAGDRNRRVHWFEQCIGAGPLRV